MSRRVVIKLGSSVVAADGDVLHRICGVVADAHEQGREVVMVSSGAIARGVSVLGLPGRPVAIEELQAASAVGQGKLYRVYDELLRDRGVTSAQVLLTFADVSVRSHYLNARQTLQKLLEWRVVPVINENDTTATDEISFGDNDFLAAQVAVLTAADLLVVLSDIDGLYTADPRRDPGAKLIGEVDDFEALSALQIGHTTSPLGTGGMRSKVLAAEMATAAGIRTVICNGIAGDALQRVLAGELVGTSFPPRASRYSSFKLWLRYAKPSHGSVGVDAGAAKALLDGGTSLLPVGIVEVAGSFEAGDAVEILAGGTSIGKGICNYSADELRRIKGMKTAAARELLPEAVEEAIHRDYMVVGQ
ncbi:MAG: glutamate 5-kinase [Solirubrobacteraceae bacterium]